MYESTIKKGIVKNVTKELVIISLDDEKGVFSVISRYGHPVYRSFPQQEFLTVPVTEVLWHVLLHGSIQYSPDSPGVQECYKMGWIHSHETSKSGVLCFFPSRLHKKYVSFILARWPILMHHRYVEYYFQASAPKPFPFRLYGSLEALCMSVIKSFSHKNLITSAPSLPLEKERPETQFQNEWYRAFHVVVGNGVGISSEWSGGQCQGRIDFRITEPCWGVEILRDGDRLSQHCNRFEKQGLYYDWISDGLIKEWLILDCSRVVSCKVS